MPYLSQVSFRAPLFSCTSTRAFTLNCRLAAPLPLSGGRDGIVFLFLGSPALRQTQTEGGGEGRREGGREEGGRSAGGWLTDSTASSPVSLLKKNKKKTLLRNLCRASVANGIDVFTAARRLLFALSRPSRRRVQSMAGIERLISLSNVP